MKTMLCTLPALLCMCWTAGARELGEDPAGLALGVVIEQSGIPAETGEHDIAAALRAALEREGVGRASSIATSASFGRGSPENGEVRRLAANSGLSALVVGRVTRLGGRLSVDVRLRSGRSGAVLGTYVAEVALDEPVEPAIQSLAAQLVLGALTRRDPEPLPGSPQLAARPAAGAGRLARPRAESPAPRLELAVEPATAAVPFGLGGLSEEPVSIGSGELEASEREGIRTLVFSDVVEVRQGDLQLDAQELVASYPEGDRQPSRLEARGDVRVSQEGRRAYCAEAVYDRERQQIDCRGDARIEYAGDEIRGEQISFDLEQRGIRVEGGVVVQLEPGAKRRVSALASLGGAEDAEPPLVARAQSLHAEQEPDLQRVVLEGDVEVVQGDVTLRSQRLELFYPEGARHPQRMEASGEVSLVQGLRQATCKLAVYREDPHGIDCLGGALRDGEDQIAGDRIHFDLGAQRVRVEGFAKLVLAPRPGAGKGEGP